MEAETIIAYVLNNAAPVTALVGTRIFGSLPTDATTPFVYFTRTDTESFPYLEGQDFERAEITVSCWANDFPTVLSLATAVKGALRGYKDANCQGIFFKRQVSVQTEVQPLLAGINMLFWVFSMG